MTGAPTPPVVTVYTAGPTCQPCNMTKHHLNRRGITFTEVHLDEDEHTAAAVRYLGFTTAPVVIAATAAGEQVWQGYRPDRIDALTADS